MTLFLYFVRGVGVVWFLRAKFRKLVVWRVDGWV